MNYGSSAVRLDMGKDARIRVRQYFGIPGTLSSAQIVKYPSSVILLPSTHSARRFLL